MEINYLYILAWSREDDPNKKNSNSFAKPNYTHFFPCYFGFYSKHFLAHPTLFHRLIWFYLCCDSCPFCVWTICDNIRCWSFQHRCMNFQSMSTSMMRPVDFSIFSCDTNKFPHCSSNDKSHYPDRCRVAKFRFVRSYCCEDGTDDDSDDDNDNDSRMISENVVSFAPHCTIHQRSFFLPISPLQKGKKTCKMIQKQELWWARAENVVS